MSQATSLPRSTPEEQGISSSALLQFVDILDKTIHEPHSFMVVRHGHVVAEGWWTPYAHNLSHMLFSLSKSFTSTAVGLAVAEGRLSLTDQVLSFFPEFAPSQISDHLAAMQVRHLLTMSNGHTKEVVDHFRRSGDDNWIRAFLATPVEYEPGTQFVYDNGSSYMLSAIVQKLTGQTLLEYLTPRLFEPLGIMGAAWDTCPRGICCGGFGLNLKTEDIARFGQLYLQKGNWNGRQLIPAAWVEEATSRQISNLSDPATAPTSDKQQGYCYQFWRCRHDAYRGDGAFGQNCIVFPKYDAVLATTCGTDDLQAVLDVVWDYLLPAFGPAPLPAAPSAQSELRNRLGGLKLPPPQTRISLPGLSHLSGRGFRVEPNELNVETLSFEFSATGCDLVMQTAGIEQRIQCGKSSWIHGCARLPGLVGNQPVVASGIWSTPNIFQITIRAFQTPYYYTLPCQFDGDTVSIAGKVNLSFTKTELSRLVGHLIQE